MEMSDVTNKIRECVNSAYTDDKPSQKIFDDAMDKFYKEIDMSDYEEFVEENREACVDAFCNYNQSSYDQEEVSDLELFSFFVADQLEHSINNLCAIT